MFTTILLGFFTVIGAFVYWCINQKRRYRSIDHLAGPPQLPVIGSALEFGFNPTDVYKNFMRLTREYGPVYKVWNGPNKCYLMITDPDFVEFILSSSVHIHKSADYELYRCWLSNGLLLSSGSHWHKKRKIITPAFHFKILEEFIPIMITGADTLVDILSKHVGQEVFDVYPYIANYALDNICETSMGTSINAQHDLDNKYIKAVRGLSNILIMRMFSIWKMFDILYKFSNDYKIQQKYLETIFAFTRNIIEKRRKELLSRGEHIDNTKDYVDEFGRKRKVAFLDLLLQATVDGRSLTDEEISEEVDTFMFAGHDSTSTAISVILYELSRNPNVQNKVMEEIRELFGIDKNRALTINDLGQMKYTEAVIKESLRMYPSAPFIGRTLQEDVYYKGMLLPKGLQLFIVIIAMHRRPELFKDPDTFNPERFVEEDHSRNNFSYIPFSAGSRNCIGQRFALNEIKVSLYKILNNYELLPANKSHDLILSCQSVLKSANGVSIRLKNREF